MVSFTRKSKFFLACRAGTRRCVSSGLSFAILMTTVPSQPSWAAGSLSAVWANDGGDKVAQGELRATANANGVRNSIWDGSTIRIFGAKNEVVNFNLVLEASGGASNVNVSLNTLTGPGGATIGSVTATGDQVFNYVNRNIELFYIRYLQLKGVSTFAYENYDERHVPRRMRRPWAGQGIGAGTWANRPDHDAMYPDIAVPLELVPTFTIAAGQNQSVWGDIYIPKASAAGVYTGTITVKEGGAVTRQIPIQLTVRNFTLPDSPSAKTMLYFSSSNISRRYVGAAFPAPTSAAGNQARQVRDRHFLMAHRHKISLIGDDPNDCGSPGDAPCAEWIARLNGSLFTAANGYAGPGVSVGNNVYSIGTYGSWGWKAGNQSVMNLHTDAWATWFNQNSPSTEYFLYLADESPATAQMETWSQYILNNPGPGRNVKSFATARLPSAAGSMPSLDIVASTLGVGITSQWQPLVDSYTTAARKRFYMYNGHRPATGSFATEDDGVALREIAWVQYKKKINRWFFWESTYYDNYQGHMGQTNVFRTALTFGTYSSDNASLGQTGLNYTNGEGVLFYPGTDQMFPADSYGVNGPFASLRLKHWRRGIQDVDYLTMAASINPSAVQTLVNSMVPKALWEYGVSDPADPTWVRTDISWSTDPDVWESARSQLATIIEGSVVTTPTVPRAINNVTATAENGQVTISWPSLSCAELSCANSYNLYYKQGLGVTIANGTRRSGVTDPAVITGLTNGQLYSFILTGVNGVGEGPASAEVLATPGVVSTTGVQLPGQPVFTNLQPAYPMTGRLQATASRADRIRFTFIPRQNRIGKPRTGAEGISTGVSVSAASSTGLLIFNSVAGLEPGPYQIEAVAENSAGVSSPVTADIFLAMADNSAVRVFPNPWRSDRHSTPITFDQMSVNSIIKIFTLSGHLVRQLPAPTGQTSWDLKNDHSDRVASGIYIYLITNDLSQKVRGKLAVIR